VKKQSPRAVNEMTGRIQPKSARKRDETQGFKIERMIWLLGAIEGNGCFPTQE
jgi:hypothetical protein